MQKSRACKDKCFYNFYMFTIFLKIKNEINDSLGYRPVAQIQRRLPVSPVFKRWNLEKTGLRWDRAPPDLVRQVAADGAQPAFRVRQIRTFYNQEPVKIASQPRSHSPKSWIKEKNQTIKSVLHQQKQFLTVPVDAPQTAPSVANTVAHNSLGCCKNNFCSS